MKTTSIVRLALAAWLLVALALSTPTATVEAGSPFTEPDFAKIDSYVRDEMAASPIPGIALGIVRGDKIVHLQGFGVAGPDGKLVTPQTPFRIASARTAPGFYSSTQGKPSGSRMMRSRSVS